MKSIYIIQNVRTGKVYIGQSKAPRSRWSTHKASLRAGSHHCVHLQRAWNLEPIETFHFYTVIKGLTNDEADHDEILLIQWFKDLNLCYNCTTGGNRNHSHTMATKEKIRRSHLGKQASPETRKRQSEARKGKLPWNKGLCGYTIHSEEYKQSLSNRMKGNKPTITEQTRKKMSKSASNRKTEPRAKTYRFINPCGREVLIHNLKKFCKENNLSFTIMLRLQKGTQKYHRGWSIKEK